MRQNFTLSYYMKIMICCLRKLVILALFIASVFGAPKRAREDGGTDDERVSKEPKYDPHSSYIRKLKEEKKSINCSLNMTIMNDPVCAPDGFIYERSAIEKHVDMRQNSPQTLLRMEPIFNSVQMVKDRKRLFIENLMQITIGQKKEVLAGLFDTKEDELFYWEDLAPHAMRQAITDDHVDWIPIIINRGGDAILSSPLLDTGKKPFFFAVEQNKPRILQKLLENEGAIEDGDEIEALFIASEEGHTEMVRVLLARLENEDDMEDETNGDGDTAFDIAAKNGHLGVFNALLEFCGYRTITGKTMGESHILLTAIERSYHALRFVSDELKNDREIVLAAVKQNGLALQYASEELRNDREFVLAAVKQDGWALQHASEEFKNDREFVLAAIEQNGEALQYASEELKNDREIVLAAVEQNGWAFRYASEELKNDREIILAAIK